LGGAWLTRQGERAHRESDEKPIFGIHEFLLKFAGGGGTLSASGATGCRS
jgi:hypothetical protein